MEEPALEASCSVVCGCHICSILATSNEDLQMRAQQHMSACNAQYSNSASCIEQEPASTALELATQFKETRCVKDHLSPSACLSTRDTAAMETSGMPIK